MSYDATGTPHPSDPHTSDSADEVDGGLICARDVENDACQLVRAFPDLDKSVPPRIGRHLQRPSSDSSRQLPFATIALATTMDYSANDPDHPGGVDPWASSPQHSRQFSGQPATNDIPSSPLPPQASPYGEGSEQYGYMGDQNTQSRPTTASENGDHPQQPQTPGQDAPHSQHPQQAQQQAPGQGQQPQRYHGNRPQRTQQHYKLQAKVTGLERNGKKDPILRFDVYVRHNVYLPRASFLPAMIWRGAQLLWRFDVTFSICSGLSSSSGLHVQLYHPSNKSLRAY